MSPTRAAPSSRLWVGLCRLVTAAFYRRVEVAGAELVPRAGPLVVVANHYNSLADVLLLQSCVPRLLHPLARSGLFERAPLRWILAFIQAVPIYRAIDAGSDTRKNRGSFDRCYELLALGEALVMFPEGVSHSQPGLQPLKTGAARIVLGAALRGGALPRVQPAGLTFVEKGRFRGRVLIQFGAPLDLGDLAAQARALAAAGGGAEPPGEPAAEPVRELTRRIDAALRALTLNAESWEDLALLRQLERFFHFRRGRHPGALPLAARFRTMQRLIDQHRVLRHEAPAEVADLRRKLEWFERVRRRLRLEEYQLRVETTWLAAASWLLRYGLPALVLLPLALFGIATSGLPYWATGRLARRLATRYDQWDTQKIVVGLGAFALTWGALLTGAYRTLGLAPALVLAAALPIGGAVALLFLRFRDRVFEQWRAFLLFRRREDLQRHLIERRREIEDDLARLAKRIKPVA